MQDFLADDEGLARVASLDLADPLREYGYLVPDHLMFRAEPAETQIDLPALVEAQKPFWSWLEGVAAQPLDKRNPAYGYHQYVLRLASKVANNIGFMQVERGDKTGALATF